MEPSALLDMLRFTHLGAMAVGLGCAFLCDFALLSRLHRGLSSELAALLHLAHPVIWGALGVMWASGLTLAAWRTGLEFGQVSPKLMAKFVVVALLTANAWAIGRHALPRLRARGPQGLQGISRMEHRAAAVLAGVSAASWLLALALGSSRLLAGAPAPVFVILLPLAYASAIATAHWVIDAMRRPVRRVVPAPSQGQKGARSYRLRDTPWPRRRAA